MWNSDGSTLKINAKDINNLAEVRRSDDKCQRANACQTDTSHTSKYSHYGACKKNEFSKVWPLKWKVKNIDDFAKVWWPNATCQLIKIYDGYFCPGVISNFYVCTQKLLINRPFNVQNDILKVKLTDLQPVHLQHFITIRDGSLLSAWCLFVAFVIFLCIHHQYWMLIFKCYCHDLVTATVVNLWPCDPVTLWLSDFYIYDPGTATIVTLRLLLSWSWDCYYYYYYYLQTTYYAQQKSTM